jgi:hypothetical protein
MTNPVPDTETVVATTLILARSGGFPVKCCAAKPHQHKGVACPSPGKRPLDPAWQAADVNRNLSDFADWLDEGYTVGVGLSGRLIGLDADVTDGLERFFARVNEPVPVSMGDVVPATGKRHLYVEAPYDLDDRDVIGTFSDGNGVKLGEVARKGARQFIVPGSPWVSPDGSVSDTRVWNEVEQVATLSEAAMGLLLRGSNGAARLSVVSAGGDWTWDVDMGSRHVLLLNESRRLAGSIRDAHDLAEMVWKWGQRHGLTGPHPETGRSITPDEVLDMCITGIAKFDEDPAPITLLVPRAEAYQQQEKLAAQQATLRTLTELPFGTPPSPLVLGTFIAPEGWTVLYANGGTGKGLLALWMMRHVLFEQPDITICVLDYEGHEWEWGNRARAMGWSQAEMDRVFYVDPYDPAWKAGHTLAGLAPELRRVGDDLGVGLYVVDSYTTAASSESELGGAKGAVEFFKGGAALGVPGLVLAHTSSSDERFPAKPFGSVFVHNLARETWAGSQMGSETNLTVPGLFGVTATSIQVELRNKKRSAGGKVTAQQGFDIEFRSNGDIRVDYQQNYERPVRDLILDVLATTTKPMTAKALSAAIREDTERVVDETTIRRTIARGIDGVETSVERPYTYSLSSVDEAS